MNQPISSQLLARPVPFAPIKNNHGLRLDPAAEARAHAAGARVGISRAHESAQLHVTGSATYTTTFPSWPAPLHCALGLAPVAAGRLLSIDLALLAAQPGVVRVFTAADIPGSNDWGSIVHDDPILWAATSATWASRCSPWWPSRASRRARRRPGQKVLIQAEAAAGADAAGRPRQGQYVVPPMHLVRSQQRLDEAGIQARIQAAPQSPAGPTGRGRARAVLSGRPDRPRHPQRGRHACALLDPAPQRDAAPGGARLARRRTTCWSNAGAWAAAFGGKESQSALFACVASVAAQQLQRPVKLRLDRDDDFLITGRRHCFWYEYDVGYDDAGASWRGVTMVSRAGHSGRPVGAGDDARDVPLRQCLLAARGRHARLLRARPTRRAIPRFAVLAGPGRDRHRVHPRQHRPPAAVRDPLDVRRAQLYGTATHNITPICSRCATTSSTNWSTS